MSFPPDVYLIGAQKSGTTTLAYLLAQHPDICMSNPKEPHFFATSWYKGLNWYRDRFSNCEDAICVDASTTYSMAPLSLEQNSRNTEKYLQDVPQRIYSINPNARFIYLLRDPVERAYSGYWHHYTAGREQKKFEEAIRNDFFYVDVSNYYGQLALWLEYFPIESFQFILFEDMKKNLEYAAKTCFKFIGIDSENIQLLSQKARNKSKYVNGVGRQFNRLFTTLDSFGFGYVAPSPVKSFIRMLTTDYQRALPPMQEKDRTFLREYFYDKNRKLELLTGLSLSQWQA